MAALLKGHRIRRAAGFSPIARPDTTYLDGYRASGLRKLLVVLVKVGKEFNKLDYFLTCWPSSKARKCNTRPRC